MARPTKSVDSLSIEITANAQNASNAINTLVRDIGTLSNAINGMNMNNITSQMQNFGQAINNINARPLVNNINQLANATRRYNNVANNMGNVNNQFANNMGRIATASYRVTSGMQRINDKLNSFIMRARSANKETKNFAQTVGLLYARFFLLIRGVKTLTKQVKSSMDYIEVMNYFDSSMGQVAERGVSKWAEMGYDSAEAYYESFSSRAKEVTRDMSGFYPEKNGTLTKSGTTSLGMNPQQLLQYQAQYAQMASSMGTTSEQALKLSEVMTKLGADLASVKNIEFEDAWRDLTSGMVGMSRTVDKYGANIRNANMQQKLMELGINANVSALSQADKALLRTIIILDATKYGWTDLASTLDTPANQFRMLANNVKLLGQLIGNILLPVVAKILPYLNAFVIALQRLFTWLAKVLGIDLSRLMAKDKTPDNSALSDMLDEAEGLGDALDNDAKNAKKLKKQLQGFDALNNLTSKDDSTTGALDGLGNLSGLLDSAFDDAVKDYLDAWDEAFKKLTNDAEKIADKISNFFIHLFDPIRRAWKNVGEDFKESWKNAFKEVGKLVKSFMVSFWRVWGETNTQKIFEHIIGIFADIGDIVANLAMKFREAWDENLNGYTILKNIRNIALTIVEGFHAMSSSVKSWTENINFAPLLSKFGEFLEAVNVVVGHLMDVMLAFLNKVILPLGKWTLEEGLPRLLQVFIDLKDKVDWEGLKNNLKGLFDRLEPFAERIGGGLILFIEQISDKLAKLVNGKLFNGFIKLLERFIDSLTEEDIADLLWGIIKAFIAFKIAFGTFKLATGLANLVNLFTQLRPLLTVIGSGFARLGNSIKGTRAFTATLGKLTGAIQNTIVSLGGTGAGGLAGIWEFLSMDVGALVSSGSVATIGASIGTALVGGILASIVGSKIGNKLGQFLFPKDEKYYEDFSWFGEGGFFDSAKYFFTEMIPDAVGGMVGKIKEAFGNFKEIVTNAFGSLKETVANAFMNVKQTISDVWNGIGEWFTSNVIEPIANAWENLKNSRLAQIFEGINILFRANWIQAKEWMSSYIIEPIQSAWANVVQWFSENIFVPMGKMWNFLSEQTIAIFAYLGRQLSALWSNFASWFVNTVIAPLSNAWNGFKETVVIVATNAWETLKSIWGFASSWFKENVIDKIIDGFVGAGEMIKNAFTTTWEFLKNGFKGTFNFIIGIIQNCINSLIGGLNKFFEFFNQAVSKASQITGDKWSGIKPIGKITLAKYATGGFPEAGQLFLAREAGAEMVGSMNGKTTVANNDQIVEGIASGVYSANQEQNALLIEQNNLLRAILEKDTGISDSALFRSVQNSANSYYKMTGNKAFA